MYHLLNTDHPVQNHQAPPDHSPSSLPEVSGFVTLLKVSSPVFAGMADGITTTLLAETQEEVKQKLLVWATQQLEAPIWAHHDSQPWWVLPTPCIIWTAPTGLSCGCKPQITSAKLAAGVSWWACRNGERGTTWWAQSAWVWMTCLSPNEAPWEEKI